MKEHAQLLRAAFCAEMHERLQRVQGELSGPPDAHWDAEAFDRLHQEFDTLFGAARAVNCQCMENRFRAMAELARSLRRRGLTQLPRAERTVFAEGVAAGLRCGEHIQCGQCCTEADTKDFVGRVVALHTRPAGASNEEN